MNDLSLSSLDSLGASSVAEASPCPGQGRENFSRDVLTLLEKRRSLETSLER
jgi:hypothetical protein